MPFKKGDPNINRGGRPLKGACFTDLLRENLERVDVEIDDGTYVSGKAAIIQRLKELAIRGDLVAIKYIIDRVDGTPRQSIDLDAKMEGSLTQDFFRIEMIDPKNSENATPSDSTD